MTPKVFQLLMAYQPLVSVIGSRVYPYGMAPAGDPKPYVTWTVVSGEPENSLSCRPDIDMFIVQFDVFAYTASDAENVAKLIRDAIESDSYVVSDRGSSLEPETKLVRNSFDAQFHTFRAEQ